MQHSFFHVLPIFFSFFLSPYSLPFNQAATMALAKMPRDGSYVRTHDMCIVSGKSRSIVRPFGLCRNVFRQMALYNMIPGVTKSSW